MKTRIERMKHRRPLPLEFLEDRNLLSPVIPSAAAEVQHDHVTVPFKMTFDGVRSILPGSTLPGPVYIKLEADGNATHWGRFHLSETHTLTTVSVKEFKITDGLATFTLANGDIVTATYTGTAHVLPTTSPNPSLEVDLTYTITAVTARNKGEPGDTFQLTLLTDPNHLLTDTNVPVTATGSGYITK